jgi:phage gpG-like protein
VVAAQSAEILLIHASFDARDLERALDEMARRGEHGGPFFRELAPHARQDQREHAQQKHGPEAPWKPRAEETADKLRRKRKRRPLLGRLPGAIQVKVHQDAIEIRSRVEWSGIHQEGGRANHGAEMPARPFLWWSPGFLEDVEEAALLYVTHNWGR